jgi:hypothetical protein
LSLLLLYLCRCFSAVWLTIGAYLRKSCFIRPVCIYTDDRQVG